MPEISRFFGIVVRMFAEAGSTHHRPHVHAFYQNWSGVLAIDTIEMLEGDLPVAQARLLEAWSWIHQQELLADWERLRAGRSPFKIEPLR